MARAGPDPIISLTHAPAPRLAAFAWRHAVEALDAQVARLCDQLSAMERTLETLEARVGAVTARLEAVDAAYLHYLRPS